MKTLLAVLFAQAVVTTELPPPPAAFTAAQGQAVVLQLDAAACATPVLVLGSPYPCRPDNALILGIPADARVGTFPVTTPSGKTVVQLTIAETAWQIVHRRAGTAPKPAPPGRRERDEAAKTAAYQAHLDSLWSNYHLRVPLWEPVSVAYTVGDGFGQQRFYGTNPKAQPHNGVDIGAPTRGGWSINPPTALSMAPGIVMLADNLWLEGNTVILYHGDGTYTAYCHLGDLRVKTGDLVSAGYALGTIGSTGHAFGVHVHLTMRIRDAYVNPIASAVILNHALPGTSSAR